MQTKIYKKQKIEKYYVLKLINNYRYNLKKKRNSIGYTRDTKNKNY